MDLRPLARWDSGFESCRVHGCLYFVNVVCFKLEASGSGLVLVQRSLTECSVPEGDDEA